jgi:hypothetical protein
LLRLFSGVSTQLHPEKNYRKRNDNLATIC